ncbi:hypothetical protein AQ490_25535 [Wenjunlia vitaminophila]|uniref:Uncharacterized protein n=1 Tax=Wenjunlia vitaminophila TaxID=76728 RepID=A0A0T6LQH0_WENVI|nr:hypothetical protein AQ490_25535 [Wenjunlia vitaminophila]
MLPAPGHAAAEVTRPLRRMVAWPPVADEHREGYDRDLYRRWTDNDHDGCSTAPRCSWTKRSSRLR